MASSLPKKQLFPEELVRQRLLRLLTQERGFPRSLIVIERELSLLPHLDKLAHLPTRRIDLLAYEAQTMRPLLLVECKAVKLTERAIEQVLGYNHYIGAPYICLANQDQLMTGWRNPATQKIVFIDGLPTYEELIENLPSLRV